MNKLLYPSFRQLGEDISGPPFMFFHIKKTGGVSVYSGLRQAFLEESKSKDKTVVVARVDDITTDDSINVLKNVSAFMNRLERCTYSGIVASHIPTEVMSRINQPFRLITVLRDPVSRLVSEYSYLCMRSSLAPDAWGFMSFAEKEENKNVMLKTLAGTTTVNSETVRMVYEFLKENFYAYCFDRDIGLLLSTLLSVEGLPNLRMNRQNETLPQYKYSPSNEEIERVKSLNLEDILLVEKLALNPLKLPLITRNKGAHSKIIEIEGVRSESGYRSTSKSA